MYFLRCMLIEYITRFTWRQDGIRFLSARSNHWIPASGKGFEWVNPASVWRSSFLFKQKPCHRRLCHYKYCIHVITLPYPHAEFAQLSSIETKIGQRSIMRNSYYSLSIRFCKVSFIRKIFYFINVEKISAQVITYMYITIINVTGGGCTRLQLNIIVYNAKCAIKDKSFSQILENAPNFNEVSFMIVTVNIATNKDLKIFQLPELTAHETVTMISYAWVEIPSWQ